MNTRTEAGEDRVDAAAAVATAAFGTGAAFVATAVNCDARRPSTSTA
ncbi:MAG: hypothetical protein P8Y26_06505 [Gemmatimonadales bacterium]